MGLNGFSQDPVQAPMSLSCCSAFEWLSPLGLGSGMRCEEQESSPLEQNSSASTSPPSRSGYCREKTQRFSFFIAESNTRSSVYVLKLTIKMFAVVRFFLAGVRFFWVVSTSCQSR